MEEPQVVVHVNAQRDGYVFGLNPKSEHWLKESYPERLRVPLLFIGLDRMQTNPSIHPTIMEQVMKLLTGLSMEELNQVASYMFYNPRTQQKIINSLEAYV